MPEDKLTKLDTDELIAALSDKIDAMDERAFDPAALDAYLDALDAAAGGASEWDAAQAERTLRAKHEDLFAPAEPAQTPQPALEVLPGGKGGTRRPHGRRLAGRIAAIAAVAAIGTMLVCQAMGIDLLGFFGQWGREQFWFPDTEQTGGMPGTPSMREGAFGSLDEALKQNGAITPMAPTWTPGAAEGFGPLTETAEAYREAQSALFTADYRDKDGRGYTVEILRYDFSSGTMVMRAFGREEAEEYVRDGVAYYIGRDENGIVVNWNREGLQGAIDGDLDMETARRMVDSITRPQGKRVYTVPDPDRELLGNDLPSMLSVHGYAPELAPTWLPEGFERTELCQHDNHRTDGFTLYAAYDHPAQKRQMSIQLGWWEDIGDAMPVAFAGDWAEEQIYPHNGTDFRIQSDGTERLVTWSNGHVTGWFWGDLSLEETLKIVDSFPDWPDEKPAPVEDPDVVVSERVENEYDSPAAGLEDLGLDVDIAPTWVPEGYILEETKGSGDAEDGFSDLYAMWNNGEEYLFFQVMWNMGSGTTIYSKDESPVVEYEHNGVRYYIMTDGDYRTAVWKDGLLEASVSGLLTLEEAKTIVDSIAYTAAEE